jgi:hypothetical protein
MLRLCSRRLFSSSRSSSSSSSVIVQKYGGTSVGGVDKLSKVFDIVSKFRNEQTRELFTFFFMMMMTVLFVIMNTTYWRGNCLIHWTCSQIIN